MDGRARREASGWCSMTYRQLYRLTRTFLVVAIVLLVWAIAYARGVESSQLNTSSDGRYHTCGLVTEDGVTEYLDAYVERCGR